MSEAGRYSVIVREQPIGFSSYIYHNILGGYLCFIFPVAAYFGIMKRNWFFAIATTLIITGLVFTTSRIAMGITLLSSLALLVILLRERQLKTIALVAIVIGAGIALAYTMLHVNKKQGIEGVISELEKKTKIIQTAQSMSMRVEVWRDSLKTFIAKPVIGHGAGAFEYAYRKHYTGGVYTRYSHSAPLKIAIELGILGLMTFLLFLGKSIHGYFQEEGNTHERTILFITLTAGLLFSLVDFSFDTPSFFITLLVIMSFFIKEKESEERKPSRGLFFFLILLLLVSFFFTAKTNLSMKSVENGNGLEDVGLLDNAYESYEDGIKEMPLNDEGFMYLGNLLIKKYRYTQDGVHRAQIHSALINYLDVLEARTIKDSELIFTKAVAFNMIHNKQKAEYYYKEALCYYPASVYYAVRLARFYCDLGNYGEAKRVITSIQTYREKYRIFKNPNGVYFYLITDIEADIAYREGDSKRALAIAQQNLKDAESDTFITSSIKAREFITRENMLQYLRERMRLYDIN